MKGVSKLVWIAITLFVAAIAIGLIGYWFFGWGGRTGTALNQAECQMRHQQACEAWRAAGWAGEMHERVICSYGRPEPCCSIRVSPLVVDSCAMHASDQIFIIEGDIDVSSGACNWWDCIAAGCAATYGIEIYDNADCGAA